jgi:hypothetical protein
MFHTERYPEISISAPTAGSRFSYLSCDKISGAPDSAAALGYRFLTAVRVPVGSLWQA